MEITEHQANMLRALADKKTLQFREVLPEGSSSFAYEYANITNLPSAVLFINSDKYEVRIKPDVIVVNCIEVPAPEKTVLERNSEYWVADVAEEDGCSGPIYWGGDEDDQRWLRYGILHLSRDAASAHGKAMRAHKPG